MDKKFSHGNFKTYNRFLKNWPSSNFNLPRSRITIISIGKNKSQIKIYYLKSYNVYLNSWYKYNA